MFVAGTVSGARSSSGSTDVRRHGHEPSSEPTGQEGGAAAVAVAQAERAAERDHLAHGLRMEAGQLAGVDPSQAPTHQAHLHAVAFMDGDEPLLDALDDRGGRTHVATQAPPVDPVAVGAQEGSQRRGGAVRGGEAGQDEHGVAVASSGGAQERR